MAQQRSDLVRMVAEKAGEEWNTTRGREIITRILEGFGEALLAALIEDEDHTVTVRGLGRFNLYRRAARQGRNAKTGEKVHIPPQTVILYKPTDPMKDAVRDVPAPETWQARKRAEAAAKAAKPAPAVKKAPKKAR